MIITARFKSECPTCGETIRKGEQIEWTKGKPAKHTRCAPRESQEDYPCSDRGYEDWCQAMVEGRY